jgi:metallo-beta-lactamase class B
VRVDRRLKDQDTLELSGVTLTAHHHPGHTKGATSFTLTVREAGRDYRVVIANMGSIDPGVTVNGMPSYPGIGDDYARTFSKQKALPVDVFLPSHAAQFGLHDKYRLGDPYDPNRFVDPPAIARPSSGSSGPTSSSLLGSARRAERFGRYGICSVLGSRTEAS